MPKHKQASLWPSTLTTDRGFDFKKFLQTQASDLKRLVKNAFDVDIEARVVESLFIYNFVIELPERDYRYQLFSLRMIGNEFPAQIVAPHLPEPRQIVPVSDKEGLEQALRLLFHDPSTTRIVATLASDGRASVVKTRSTVPG